MKKLTLLMIAISAGILSMSSCNNNDDEDPAACSGNVNFCVQIGSEQISGNASYTVITTGSQRHRISWEEGSGNNYRNVELDIYTTSLANGSYTLAENPTAGQAQLQYYTNGQGFISTSGTVEVTNASSTAVSGTFSGTVNYNGDSRQVSGGNFVNAQ